jgi:hypothetical protein
MNLTDLATLNRKSGVAQWRDLLFYRDADTATHRQMVFVLWPIEGA